MLSFVILLAGRVRPTPALLAEISGLRSIAADAGIAHAGPLQITPELIVGDFDSGAAAAEPYRDVERQSFPADKDKTDGELAIEAALARGAERLILVGALGGARSDHAFAHLVLALRYASQCLDVVLTDGFERAWPLLPGVERTVPLAAGTQLSTLKFSSVTGLSISGVVYPLETVDLPFTSILTQSNEATGTIRVRLDTGEAILIAQADPKQH